VVGFIPVQLKEGAQTNRGADAIGIGWHMPDHYWALLSKLVWPVRDGVLLSKISEGQWAAGAIAAVAGVVLLIIGSGRLRLLVLWAALALAPFSIWLLPIAPARYVYMAAIPFAIMVSWGAVSAYDGARASFVGRRVAASPALSRAVLGLVTAALLVAAGLAASETAERNRAYAAGTEPYRILAQELPAAVPAIPSNGRVIIYYGIWDGYAVWSDAVVQTIYRDRSLTVVNLTAAQVEAGGPPVRSNDRVVFYTDKGFIAPVRSSATR
jgi:hypothetical protein